ncbi:MAG: hypothetical protein ABIO39_14300 [Caulobacteraceae bacterium]
MNHYKLIILGPDLAPGPSGFVFCANDDEAKASALQALALNSSHHRVRVYLDEQLVCEVGSSEVTPVKDG